MTARTTQSDSLQLGEARIAYDVAGEGDALVLIHGGLADRSMWDDQFQVFAEHFRTIRLDLRGFGDSTSPPGSFSFHGDIRAVLDALDIERAHVLGLSFGGRIAIDFALEYPERLNSLILVGPALGGYTWSGELTRRIDEADELVESGDIARGVELELQIWIDGPNRKPDDVEPSVRERSRLMNTRNYELPPPRGSPEPPQIPAISRLGEIEIPVLVLVGGGDVEDIHRIADILVAEIPNVRRADIPVAAHHPNMERPDEFNRLVLGFLRSISVR